MSKAHWSLVAFAVIQVAVANADNNGFDGVNFGGVKNINVTKTGTETWSSATFLVDAAAASALLPAGLELNPAAVTPDGKYHISFMLGVRSNFQIALNNFVVVKDSGEDLALGSMSVRQAGGTKVYDYFWKLLENLPIGAVIDRNILGLGARFASLDQSGTIEKRDDQDDDHDNDDDGDGGKPHISLLVDPILPSFDPVKYNQKLKANLGGPVSIIGERNGRLICSVKTYDIATITGMPIKSQWTVNDSFAPGLAGQYNSSAAVSSFTFQANFTGDGPMACDP